MSTGIDNNVDWVAGSPPKAEQVGPGLARPGVPRAEQAIQRSFTHSKRAVESPPPGLDDSQRIMDKLLGQNSLAALDERGSDPYNATGRQFRR